MRVWPIQRMERSQVLLCLGQIMLQQQMAPSQDHITTKVSFSFVLQCREKIVGDDVIRRKKCREVKLR